MNNIESWTGIQNVSWVPVLNKDIRLGSQYKIVPKQGYLAWEYNPLRNYRLSQNMYEKDGKYYTQKEFKDLYPELNFNYIHSGDSETIQEVTKELPEGWTLRETGELVDFITDELSFDLSHPVTILPQYSYDGSVNLILNDGLNIPRLINSRFTVTGKNTYKIEDRKGDNDTNIYDQGKQFDVDTSLFKNVNKIPKLQYLGTTNGNMKIGNYHFYFKYADADGNESDWVAESGLVSLFIGESPQSVNTGLLDENSVKGVRFKLDNIDIGYPYVKIYYTRYSADVDSNLIVQAKRIDKNFIVTNSGFCQIYISGDENETDVTIEDINSSFDVIQNAKTQCSAANRLFMANIHKTKIEYDILSKLSLCFCPYKKEEAYPLTNDSINENYLINARSDGYYDTQYIYNKTGYWPGELYRLGIVYILKDGSLSPVFNIRGASNIPNSSEWIYKVDQDLNYQQKDLDTVLSEIDYSEEDFMIVGGKAPNENAKGVIQLSTTRYDTNPFPVVGIQIYANPKVINKLKDYVKGFFFVRQKRIPLILCQGMIVGLDKESRTPTLPTIGGVLVGLNYEKSFVETSDINDINYISEGFLGRYYFKLKPKESGILKKILTAVAVVVVIAVAVVATVFTCGAGGAIMGPAAATGIGALTAAATAGAGAVGASIGVIGLTAAAVTTVSIAAIGAQAIALHIRQNRNKGKAQALKGRYEEIPKGYERVELDESRLLTHGIASRYIIKDSSKNTPEAVIVPDYQVNQSYYNQFLTGDTFTVQLAQEQPITNFLTDGYFESSQRHFYISGYQPQQDNRSYSVKLVGVPDSCPVKMIEDSKYCARAGYPEEAHTYEFVGVSYNDSKNKRDNSDIIRGNFGSFVGIKDYQGHACDQIEIMIPGYKANKLFQYIQLRAQDTSAFYAISDRIDINDINKTTSILEQSNVPDQIFEQVCYRGDCYICKYTHRIIRNFNDPSAPYNDTIVDVGSWRSGYNPDQPGSYANINLGDVNAVQLGLWLTFQVRSSYNLNIRTIDKSNVDEHLMSGNYRSFYPHYGQLALGSQKLPDSDQYNKGFSKSVSEKYYFEVPDVPYIKQQFQNRIVFSDIHINDAYKNGFRVLRSMNHKDYPMTYGSITKLLEVKNNLIVIFEHGIGLITINNSSEQPSQVLSDLTMISDTYGSQWADSIIKTPGGIYGVDTVAKKIWRVKNGQLQLISDYKVQEFLNSNITLSERELSPIIGVRNVKTVYNAFKHDVMFTFYDNTNSISEKVWNLCWNEILEIFTTFYSWVPGEMENIDNIPFSFDRETIKAIGKLGVSNHANNYSDGVTLSNNVLYVNKNNQFNIKNKTLQMSYLDVKNEKNNYIFQTSEDKDSELFNLDNVDLLEDIVNESGFVGFLHLDNRTLPEGKVSYKIEYQLLRDRQGNHDLFEIKNTRVAIHPVNELLKSNVKSVQVYYLVLKQDKNVSDLLSELYYRNKEYNTYADFNTNMIKPSHEDYLIDMPIFKNRAGKRIMLDEKDQKNPDKIVRYLNIKAKIFIEASDKTTDSVEAYYNQFANGDGDICMIDAGYFESQVALTTDFNLSLLSTDFWKHGQAGLIDISDKIYPTYWYGKNHPFEFECVVVDDPTVHKIFTNLELVSNHVKPESFHYEVVGDVYDFADDKPTMYFRQEALKALYQYNGYNIEYNPNFLEIDPKQHNRSADLPKYYSRWDTINNVYDSYKRFAAPGGFNYDHLAGAEIVYYPNRQEFRIWNHAQAFDIDELDQNIATSVIKANCRYLEDKWLVSINPIIVTYKNEFNTALAKSDGKSMFSKTGDQYDYTSWVDDYTKKVKLPPINIQGTKLEQKLGVNIQFPDKDKKEGEENALYGLYDLVNWKQGDWRPIDPTKNSNRQETDVRGKFIKIRIRYSGEELAIIDLLNTIYQISFA